MECVSALEVFARTLESTTTLVVTPTLNERRPLTVSKRKKAVVRMLEQVVQITYGTAESGMSGIEPDESELNSRKLLSQLRHLANKDPDNMFGIYFVRLQLKLLKRLRNHKH